MASQPNAQPHHGQPPHGQLHHGQPHHAQPTMPSTPRRRHLLGGAVAVLATAGLTACGVDQAAPAATRSAPLPGTAGGTLGLGIVGIAVADLAASLAFYRRLGLAIPADVDASGGAFRLPLPNGMVFFWETVGYIQGFDPSYRPGTGDRRVILEFGFATADDVNAMYDTLLATGARSRLAPVTWNGGDIRYAIVTDPDNNQISLRWPLVS